ncbi:MAG: 50S ribosomal protein L13 [Bacteroidia bacterium]|nr:50S ribosomal protein L13 [Bacteroidia bacterium]
MDTLSYKTISLNKATVNKEWVIVDATDQILGRLASKVALVLRGKHKPGYTPHVDCGDNVIVINAEKIRLTGNKWKGKEYVRHTGYPGGQRVMTAADILKKFPERLMEKSVKGMLPKNSLGAKLFNNLYVFVGANHDKEAQQPKFINLDNIR